MILDARSHGNHGFFATALNNISEPKPLTKHKTVYFINNDEESLKARKSTHREVKSDRVEEAVVFTASALQPQRNQRKFYNSSSLGNAICPVAVPPHEDTWRLPPAVRNKRFGKRGVVLAGGACEGPFEMPTFDDGMEPVNWFAMPENWHAEVLHKWTVKFVLHLAALQDTFPLTCIRNKVGCIGLVGSDEHKQLLRARPVMRVLKDFCTEGSPQLPSNMRCADEGGEEHA